MDNNEHPALSCETLSNTAPEVQSNICTPTMKVDLKEETTSESRDEEESPCHNFKYPPEPLDSPEYVNYYDDNIDMLEDLKKEYPEDESPQSDCNMTDVNVSEDANWNRNKQITIKTERLEEQDITDSSGATSVHYDVLVTLQEVKCNLCGRIFNNDYNLLKHNNDHIKIKINTPADNDINELHQRQYCGKGFINYDDMLAHVIDVHSENNPKCKICGKQFNNERNLERHFKLSHKLKKFQKQVTAKDMKCIYCNADFKRKSRLNNHIRVRHMDKVDEEIKYKCDSCGRIYKRKGALISHIKKTHNDYRKMFECWCGKQFRTQRILRAHIIRQHNGEMNDKNNDKVQCEHCQKLYKSQYYLSMHIKHVHYDYGEVFECWCGKQFRTPMYLKQHKRRHTDAERRPLLDIGLPQRSPQRPDLCCPHPASSRNLYQVVGPSCGGSAHAACSGTWPPLENSLSLSAIRSTNYVARHLPLKSNYSSDYVGDFDSPANLLISDSITQRNSEHSPLHCPLAIAKWNGMNI